MCMLCHDAIRDIQVYDSIVDVSIVTRLGVMKEKVFCCQTLCVWRLKCRPSSLNRAPSTVITIYYHAFFALTSHISTHVCRSFKIVTVGSPLDIARSISETKLWGFHSNLCRFLCVLMTTCKRSHTYEWTFLHYSLNFSPCSHRFARSSHVFLLLRCKTPPNNLSE